MSEVGAKQPNGFTRHERGPGAAPVAGSITGEKLGNVNLAPSRGGYPRNGTGAGGPIVGNGNTTIINNNNNYYNDNSVNYITNVNNSNNCWNPGWSCAPVWGPNACWQSWNCNSGFSFGIGFGSGSFSFGLFYGSCNTPLCSNWCDPWWNGWSTFVSVGCAPSWNWCRPCWAPCGGPWWTNYCYTSTPTWCVPVYSYTPAWVVPSVAIVDYSYEPAPTIVYVDNDPPPSVVTYAPPPTVVVAAPAAMTAAETEAWDLLANGFPRSAAESFARLHDQNAANARALAGYGVSLAMLDDIPAASSVMRDAVAMDVGVLATLPLGPKLSERMQLLVASAEVASRQAAIANDSLFLLAAWRTALGRVTEAHYAITVAQQQGDTSLAAARLRAYLDARVGRSA